MRENEPLPSKWVGVPSLTYTDSLLPIDLDLSDFLLVSLKIAAKYLGVLVFLIKKGIDSKVPHSIQHQLKIRDVILIQISTAFIAIVYSSCVC